MIDINVCDSILLINLEKTASVVVVLELKQKTVCSMENWIFIAHTLQEREGVKKALLSHDHYTNANNDGRRLRVRNVSFRQGCYR
jgi:hypothetical protein